MRKFLQKIGKLYFTLPKLIQIFLIVLVYVIFQGVAVILVFEYSEQLGVFGPIILLLYAVILTGATAYLYVRREIRMLRNRYGEEFLYQAFPKERERDIRRAERRKKKHDRS